MGRGGGGGARVDAYAVIIDQASSAIKTHSTIIVHKDNLLSCNSIHESLLCYHVRDPEAIKHILAQLIMAEQISCIASIAHHLQAVSFSIRRQTLPWTDAVTQTASCDVLQPKYGKIRLPVPTIFHPYMYIGT